MILDAIPFRESLSASEAKKVLVPYVDYLEKKLQVKVVRDLHEIPFGRIDLIEPFRLAALLKEHGVIKRFGRTILFPDMPKMKGWYAICNVPNDHQAGGTVWDSDEDGLYAALAEALERYIWMTQDDYFVDRTRATAAQIARLGPYIAPENITGFSPEQRALHPDRVLHPDAEYLWIKGVSLTDEQEVFVPAQVISGVRPQGWQGGFKEPVIRQQNTNGLATWTTQSGARLGGLQELIEREAYMVMWLNQLTLPRISINELCSRFPSLEKNVAMCERYQFKTHVIQLPTDAPTHALAVVMEDVSGSTPRYSIGIKAHRSLEHAVVKAMTEAMRSYRACRLWANEGNVWDNTTPTANIGHRERLYYWAVPENEKYQEFMLRGKEIGVPSSAWDNDSIEMNLERIVQWCTDKKFDCISVSLTKSAKNPTPLHIEMVMIPQLLPTYLAEWTQQFGGTRWHDIPKALGYTALKKPFSERPHPFS